MKNEERLRAAEHEEDIHVMCEPEQGVFPEEEKEDANTEFDDKLMNRENSSYQCAEENEDVDEKSIEDFKCCFAEIDQHGKRGLSCVRVCLLNRKSSCVFAVLLA